MAIIIGYQGIGKSSLSKNGNGFIDLESGNFWVDGKRADNWYVPYTNIAKHLSNQGYTVFTSSHKVVREQLKGEKGVYVAFPDISLGDKWVERLENRYRSSRTLKDYRAWANASSGFDENIKDLMNEDFPKIIIKDIDYNLYDVISNFLKNNINNK